MSTRLESPAARTSPAASARAGSWPVGRQVAVLVVVSAALFAQPFLQLVEVGERNGLAHVQFAVEIAETGVLYPGHFLYHVLAVGVHAVSPLSWSQAHFVVVLAARVVTAVVVWSLIRRALRSRDTSDDVLTTVVLTLALTTASAVSFVTWPAGNHYLGYVVANLTVSQTLVVLQPLAVLAFAAVVAVLRRPALAGSRHRLLMIAVLVAVGTLAKPSYTMVLLPAAGVLILVRLRRLRTWPDRRPLLELAAALVVPAALATVWVYVSTYLEFQADEGGTSSGVGLSPFKVMSFYEDLVGYDSAGGIWLVVKLLLSLVFPLAVAVAYPRAVRTDLRLQLAWLQFAFGALFMYAIAEEPVYEAGNFTWSAHIALFVLFVASALVLVEQTMAGATSRWAAVVDSTAARWCYGALALHAVAGVGLMWNPTVT